MKHCNRCKQMKSFSVFYKRGDKIVGYRSCCKPCYTRLIPAQPNAGNRSKLTKDEQRQSRLDSYKKWRLKNPHRSAVNEANRRARKLKAQPSWLSDFHKEEIKSHYEFARMLTASGGMPVEVDHIVPLRGKEVCGLHVPWNLQITSREHNMRKGTRCET